MKLLTLQLVLEPAPNRRQHRHGLTLRSVRDLVNATGGWSDNECALYKGQFLCGRRRDRKEFGRVDGESIATGTDVWRRLRVKVAFADPC